MRKADNSRNKKRNTIFVTKHPVNYAVLKASSLDDVDWLKFKYDAGHTKALNALNIIQCAVFLCIETLRAERTFEMKNESR